MSERPSYKPRDPLVSFLVAAFAAAAMFLFVWFVFAVGLWIGVLNVGTTAAYIGGAVTWLYPMALIASATVAWRAYRTGDARRARIAALVPYLWVIPIFLIILIRGS